jgi:type I restriction-modification system DNA methylase subunit
LRSAFQNLLAETARARSWTPIPELSIKIRGRHIRPDGTLRDDEWQLPRGYWEAKDTGDALDDEIRTKIGKGYPLVNTDFLNTVYERFFQGYSVKVADTHGIVYTPQEIVDFMCASVQEVLRAEFGLGLASPDVRILDPCTGTGNFIVNLMRRVEPRDLPRFYQTQLFANEVMLLPYDVAAHRCAWL